MLVLLTTLLLYFFGFRRSVFGVSFKNSHFAGLILVKELMLLVLLGVVLLEFFSVDSFYALHYVESSSVEYISWLILYSVFVFLVTIIFIGKYLFPSSLRLPIANSPSPASLKRIHSFAIYLFFFYGICLVLIFNFWGHHHAFFSAIFEGASLKQIRMENKYESNVPSVIISLVSFQSTLVAILAGSPAFRNKILQRSVLFFSALVFAGSSGEKAPLLNIIVIFFLSCASFSPKRFGFGSIFGTFILGAALSILILFAVSIQYPTYNADDYILYFINRIGVGQISGVYEQFNLFLYDPEYIYHAIPFANFFLEYTPFQKDLMIISEDVKNAASTGVKNSLFLSEAMGIGGWWLAIASPFIVAINYVLSYIVISKLINSMLLHDRYLCSKICPLLFIYIAPLTGGFSEWLFLKLLVIYVIYILITFLPFNIFHWLLRAYPRQTFRSVPLN